MPRVAENGFWWKEGRIYYLFEYPAPRSWHANFVLPRGLSAFSQQTEVPWMLPVAKGRCSCSQEQQSVLWQRRTRPRARFSCSVTTSSSQLAPGFILFYFFKAVLRLQSCPELPTGNRLVGFLPSVWLNLVLCKKKGPIFGEQPEA